MNILLIGGSGSLMNNLIIKLNKEGHRIYLLTGSKYDKEPYQKVFERYNFTYDSTSLDEIFESVNPDITVFAGAYDTNFNWEDEETESVRFMSAVTNIMMAYAVGSGKRFVYLSSQDVFGYSVEEDIKENAIAAPRGYRSMVLAQAEEMCSNYRTNRNLDVMVLRMDHLYCIPESYRDVQDPCTQMCMEALIDSVITIRENHQFSLLYVTDAVEMIYKAIMPVRHEHALYNLTAGDPISEQQMASKIQSSIGYSVETKAGETAEKRCVLSGERYEKEFGITTLCNRDAIIRKIVNTMKKNRHIFLYGESKPETFLQRLLNKSGWLMKTLIPFAENLLAFLVFFLLNSLTADSRYFARLDMYLLYVFLFAVVYGQQQAIVSAVLSVVGFVFLQGDRSNFDIVLDPNTYVWIAQLFIVGLTVGYMRDYISKLKEEQRNEKEFLSGQLKDIRDINNSNIRVKEALETQIVNQNDSIGKIYSITSTLDQYSPEEILFYAAEMIAKLMKTRDVAIYMVSNDTYARLFSSTSGKARELGGSIRYTEMGELYEDLKEDKVYINRQLDEKYPMMAKAIFDENGNMQTIIMLWGMTWESMTLGQANQLTVISALIHSSVMRANKYLAALDEERYIAKTRTLEPEAFTTLMNTFVAAEKKGLTDCTVIRIDALPATDKENAVKNIWECLRTSDYLGLREDNKLYVLLSNTPIAGAQNVVNRLCEMGYQAVIWEDGPL